MCCVAIHLGILILPIIRVDHQNATQMEYILAIHGIPFTKLYFKIITWAFFIRYYLIKSILVLSLGVLKALSATLFGTWYMKLSVEKIILAIRAGTVLLSLCEVLCLKLLLFHFGCQEALNQILKWCNNCVYYYGRDIYFYLLLVLTFTLVFFSPGHNSPLLLLIIITT